MNNVNAGTDSILSVMLPEFGIAVTKVLQFKLANTPKGLLCTKVVQVYVSLSQLSFQCRSCPCFSTDVHEFTSTRKPAVAQLFIIFS